MAEVMKFSDFKELGSESAVKVLFVILDVFLTVLCATVLSYSCFSNVTVISRVIIIGILSAL